MKTCTVCKETKPLSEFYNYKATKDKKSYRCKCCDNLARKSWAEANPLKSQESQRGRNLKHRYGIDLIEYRRLLEAQGGRCAICGVEENAVVKATDSSLSFAVDHDHATGKVRGLLCNQCNRGIGLLGDSSESLKKAVNYLETH